MKCRNDWCNREAKANPEHFNATDTSDLCDPCYLRLRRRGTVDRKLCEVNACGTFVRADGRFCAEHRHAGEYPRPRPKQPARFIPPRVSDEQRRDTARRGLLSSRARRANLFVEAVTPSAVFERDGGICHLCLLPAEPDSWELDHVIPVTLGGPLAYGNSAVSHRSCNRSKSNHHATSLVPDIQEASRAAFLAFHGFGFAEWSPHQRSVHASATVEAAAAVIEVGPVRVFASWTVHVAVYPAGSGPTAPPLAST